MESHIRKVIISLVFLLFLEPTSIPWIAFPFYFKGLPILTGLTVLLFAIIILFPMTILSARSEEKNIEINYYIIMLIFLFIWLICGLFYTDSLSYGKFKVLMFFVKVLAPISVIFLLKLDEDELRLVFSVILIGSIMTLANFIFYYEYKGLRGSCMGWSPLVIAKSLGLGACLVFAKLAFQPKIGLRKYLLCTCVLFALIMGIVATGSRGSLLSLIVIMVISCSLLIKSAKFNRLFMVMVLLVIGSSLLLYSNFLHEKLLGLKRYEYKLEQYLDTGIKTEGRIYLFRKAINSISETNGVGVGTGGYVSLFPAGEGERHKLSIIDFQFKRKYAHNIFLEIGVENGIIGLGILCVILIITSCKLWQIFNRRISFSDSRLSVEIERPVAFRKMLEKEYYKYVATSLAWLYLFLNIQVSGDIISNYRFWILGFIVYSFPSENVRIRPPVKDGFRHLGPTSKT